MSNENKNFDESDFEDFGDNIADNIELDSDLSAINEEDIEKALLNVTSQMAGFENIQHIQEDVKEKENAESDIAQQDSELDLEQNELTEKIESEIKKDEKVSSEQEEDSKADDINSAIEAIEESPNDEQENETESDTINKTNENEFQEDNDSFTNKDELLETDDNTKEAPDQKEDSSATPEISEWEELDDLNNVVKKYIIYISKDFVPYIDSLSTDQRSAYINDAIQRKLDSEDERKQILDRRKGIVHFLVAVFTFLLFTPLGLLFAHKAIMVTFENYKYSQENFEKLYKHRFMQDKAYIRSLEYNKEYEKRQKLNN